MAGDKYTISAKEIIETSKVTIAALGRESWARRELDKSEERAVRKVFRYGIAHLRRVVPEIAEDIERQEELAIVAAGIALATFSAGRELDFPSEPGKAGVAWLFPEAIKYAATPTADTPCYTSYKNNSWDIDVTAGTAAYLFGDSANYYKASPTENKRSFILIFENGVIELGTTPKTDTFRLESQGKANYGIYTVDPLIDVPIEKNLTVYQYPTPLGALMISYEQGIRWGFMPKVTGTTTIKLLGLVFYEHDLFPDLASTWIA